MDLSILFEELTTLDLYINIFASLKNVFIGFILAFVVAILLNMFLYEYKKIAKVVYPIIELLRPIPNAGWVPIAVISCSTIEGSILFITFVGAFFPLFLNINRALENVPNSYLNISKLYKMNKSDRMKKIVVPAILPDVFTAMMLGISGGWLSVIMAEMISGKVGLGYYTWKSYTLLAYEKVLLGIILMGLLGASFSLLLSFISKRLVFWMRSSD